MHNNQTNNFLLDLFKATSFDSLGDFNASLDIVIEKAAQYLKVDRVAIWLYQSENSSFLECINFTTLKNASNEMGKGTVLDLNDYPKYFEHMVSQRRIEVSDVYSSEACSELVEDYFRPLGINSMIDAPIWQMNKVIGVICFEYMTPKFSWSSEEKILIFGLSDLIAKIFERKNVLILLEEKENQQKELKVKLEKRTKLLQEAHKTISQQEKLASIGKLSASLSHELKNPLHLIMNSTLILKEVVKGQVKDEGSRKLIESYINVIDSSCNRANHIMQSVLSQSKIDKGKLCDVNEIIDDTLNLLWKSERDLGVIPRPILELDTNWTKQLPKTDFQRVLINILDNSIDSLKLKAEGDSTFTPEVLISTLVHEEKFCIKIRDNGLGISKNDQSYLFDPFFTSGKENGVGLGLYIVNELVKLLDGSISVESEQGQFCEFTFCIPV